MFVDQKYRKKIAENLKLIYHVSQSLMRNCWYMKFKYIQMFVNDLGLIITIMIYSRKWLLIKFSDFPKVENNPLWLWAESWAKNLNAAKKQDLQEPNT